MLNQNLKRKVYFESKAKRNKRRKFRKILVFCLFASIFFLSFYFFNKFIDGKTFAKYTSTNFTSPKKENVVNIQDVQSKLQTVVNSHPEATIGISYIDLKSGTTANVNGDTAFTAASTGKMIPAIMFLQGVENGKYSLSQRYGSLTGSYLLKQMINRSNNDCWATFNNLLGLANEQAFAAKLGLNYNPYKNTLSANDYATLLSKLYNNELLSQNSRDLLMGFMTNTNEERLIPATVENGTVYHKYGMLEGYIHDGAIIDSGNRQYVLVVYTNNPKNYDPILRSKIFQEAVDAVTPES